MKFRKFSIYFWVPLIFVACLVFYIGLNVFQGKMWCIGKERLLILERLLGKDLIRLVWIAVCSHLKELRWGELKGNWKNNRLEGGEGNDLLAGGWGHDRFVFKSGDDTDTITDFDTGYSFWGFDFSGDKVIVDVDGFDDFADVQDAMTPSGSYWNPETTIDFGNGDALIFKGVHQWQLSANDFDFV